MSAPQIIFGLVMIALGVIFVKVQMNSKKNGLKDTFGSEIRLLITGIGLVIIGIVIIIRAFIE